MSHILSTWRIKLFSTKMSSSSTFLHNYLRATTPYLTMSLRHPKTSNTLTTTSLQLRRRLHLNPKNPTRHLTPPAPSPSPMAGVTLARTAVHRHRPRFTFAVACSAASSRVSPTVVMYRKSASSPLPYFHQQSFPYGRYAYDEYASEEEESDLEVRSSQQSQQLVSSEFFLGSDCLTLNAELNRSYAWSITWATSQFSPPTSVLILILRAG